MFLDATDSNKRIHPRIFGQDLSNSKTYGFENVINRTYGPIILQTHTKESEIIDKSENVIKKWKPEFFRRRLRKVFVQHMGYLKA